MFLPRQFFAFLFLAAIASLLVLDQPVTGQGAKDKLKKGVLLNPDPLELSTTGELAPRTPVQRPALIKGAKTWTVETKRHRWSAINVAVNPEGTIAATGGYDGVIHLWDTATGKHIKALLGHASYIYGLAWSPDGTVLASTGSNDGTARVWNPKTGMTLRTLKGHKGYTNALTWSPDGSQLVVTGGSSGFATFWDVNNNKQLKTVEHGNPVTSVAWSPDGRYVACGTTNTCFLWDGDTYKNICTLMQDGNVIYAVGFSGDSKQLLTGGKSNCLVWDIETQKIAQTLAGQVTFITCSPDGKQIGTCTSGAALQLLEPGTYKAGKLLPFGVSSCSWTKEGKTLYALSGDQVIAYDVAEGKTGRSINVAASGMMFWTPGRPVVAGLGTNAPLLFDLVTGKLLATLEGHKAAVTTALWSRDFKFLATASYDKTVKIWDATGKLHRTLEGHGDVVTALAWAPDGRIATAGNDKIVRIFPATAEKADKTMPGHSHPVTTLSWSRDGKTLASGSADRSVIIWNFETSKPFKVLPIDNDLRTIAISPDGKMLATGSTDDVVRVFNLPSGKLETTLEVLGSPKDCAALAWSPDGTLIASGRANHTVQIWNWKTKTQVHSVNTMAPVHAVTWSSDGKTFAAGSADRSLRFFDLTNGKIRTTVVQDEKELISISTDGHYRVADKESELIYVVQTDKTQDTYDAKTFVTKFLWRNNSAAVTFTGK